MKLHEEFKLYEELWQDQTTGIWYRDSKKPASYINKRTARMILHLVALYMYKISELSLDACIKLIDTEYSNSSYPIEKTYICSGKDSNGELILDNRINQLIELYWYELPDAVKLIKFNPSTWNKLLKIFNHYGIACVDWLRLGTTRKPIPVATEFRTLSGQELKERFTAFCEDLLQRLKPIADKYKADKLAKNSPKTTSELSDVDKDNPDEYIEYDSFFEEFN